MHDQLSAEYWQQHLHLEAVELGGFFAKQYEASSLTGAYQLYSTNYYLLATELTSEFPTNQLALHQLKQDEQWFFLQGKRITLHVFYNDNYQRITLGSNLKQGEQLHAVVPGNSWFGAELEKNNNYALSACSLAPGWMPGDSTLPTTEIIEQLCKKFKEQQAIIKRLATVIEPTK